MKTQVDFPNLLSPIDLGPITLKHRAVLSGHGMALGDGQVGISARFQEYLLARARGGAAMVGSESAPVHSSTVSRSLGIRLYNDDVIPSLRECADKVRIAGSRLAITLWHGGHKDSFIRGSYALAPSPVPNLAGEVPKQISKSEIQELIVAYGQAAQRCKIAGLDAIELQTSTDYLLGSFLSPVLNRRKDDYGGSFLNRLRFVKQILESIREQTGDNMAVGIRTSARHDIPGAPFDYGIEESVASMKALADDGLVDYISVMTGSGWAPPESSSIAHMAQPRVQLREEGRAFKKAISVPIAIAGRIRSPEEAEQLIQEGSADIVAMARTWIADPEWGVKVASGEAHRIRPCMSCNQACVGFVFRGLPGSCLVNPVAGNEYALREEGQSLKPQNIAVIGGGPAGLEAARVLAVRGHQVELFEQNSRLGGEMYLAASAPHRSEMLAALEWWKSELAHYQVQVHLNSKISHRTQIDVDTCIWAIGGSPSSTAIWQRRPYLFEGIPGTSQFPSGREVLSGLVPLSGDVLIIDEEGGWATVSLLETIVENSEVSKVTVVTPERSVGERALSITWEVKTIAQRLKQERIQIIPETLVSSATKNFVTLVAGGSLGPFDSIVMNTGTAANETPENAIAIGDCVAPRGIWAATSDAAKLARSI
jgi:2,4-dienoyl-CoA reductase-like NADH-dependent reductase (Old Yellow Enzyme family)